jgi:hypothetical protein
MRIQHTLTSGLTFRGTFEPTGDKMTYRFIGGVTKADGEFIIRAVNAHQDLLTFVRGLRDALNDLDKVTIYRDALSPHSEDESMGEYLNRLIAKCGRS